MSALLACWVAFAVLVALVAQGCGTLVELLAGRRLELGVRIPLGMALLIAAMDLTTRTTVTAHLAVPAVVLLAAVGLALSILRSWRQADSAPWRWRPADAGLLAGVVVFAVYAAPVVLSGMATWTGYLKLDDTATWLALVDRALGHGRSLAGLPLSTYRATLETYLTTGYPLGSFLPLGLGHALLGQDIAWLVNPWMACMAATLALALHRIAKLSLAGRGGGWAPVVIAALAAQAALLYGYYLWGGTKELAGAMLIAAFAVAAPLALEGRGRLGAMIRAIIPAVVVVWALVVALSPGGLVWVGPGSLLAAMAWGLIRWLRHKRCSGSSADRDLSGGPRARGRRWALALIPIAAVALGVYLVLRAGGFVERFQTLLTGGHQLGTLIRPLSLQQLAGIWPAGDFRLGPAAPFLTHVLVLVCALCALGGLALAVRKACRELVVYLLCAVAGALLVDLVGSPWVGAKALASASPALPLAALIALVYVGANASSPIRRTLAWVAGRANLGAAAGRRVLAGWGAFAIVAGCAIALGILWSNALAYHDANLAPREQFEGLAEIGERIAGQGPTLMTEFQPYGDRHFLREAAPEAASELRYRDDRLDSGRLLQPGQSTDIDQIRLSEVIAYRTLVLQRSPVSSRPPAPYGLIYSDEFWEVWQRPSTPTYRIVWHYPLGNELRPGGVPDCAALVRLAQRPGVKQLVTEPVENPIVVAAAAGLHPRQWSTGGPQLAPRGTGTATLQIEVPRAGRYSVWLGGSTRGPLSIYVDGRFVARAFQELQESGQYLPFGEVSLTSGTHTVELRYSADVWQPGVGGPPEPVGPLVLRRETYAPGKAVSRAPLLAVPASRAEALCGRTLDWVEGIS